MAEFSTAQLVQTQLKVNAMWKDAQVNAQYIPEVDGLLAIRKNSSAKFAQLEDANTDYTVALNWLTSDGIVATPAVASCELTGPQLDASVKTYALDIFEQTSFSVNEDQLKSTIFSREEVVAQGMLKALKVMDERVAVKVMAKADSFVGTNKFLGGYTAVGGRTTIPIGVDPVTTFAYLDQARILNRMRDSYMIENGTMYQAQVKAAYNAGNLDGKGAVAAFGSLDITTDFFNMDAAGLTTDALLINRSALAFGNRALFPNVPVELGGEINETRYSVPSKSVPGLRYDVRYTMKCSVNATKNRVETLHVWQINVAAGLFLNPVYEAGNTGVLGFVRS